MGRHVCTLCNRTFEILEDGEIRCPQCLRMTGVVSATPAALAQGGISIDRRMLLRLFGGALGLALLAVGGYFLVPLLQSENRYLQLEAECVRSRVPCAWEGADQWGTPFAEKVSGQADKDKFAQLGLCLDLLQVKPLQTVPEKRYVLTGQQVAERDVRNVSSLEATGYLLGCALTAGLDVVPCSFDLDEPSQRFIDRTYGVCTVDEDGQIADHLVPFVDDEDPPVNELSIMTPGRFTSHFIAAAAKAEDRPRESYRMFARALVYDEPAEVLFHRGVVKARNGAVEFGVDDVQSALKTAPSAPGHTVLGDILMRQGTPADALNSYTSALSLNANYRLAQVGKARALLGTGAEEQALALLEQLREEDPSLPGLHAALATCYSHRGETDKAVQELREEVRQNPNPTSYGLLADHLISAGEADEAVKLLEQGYEQLNSPGMGITLTGFYAKVDRQDDALALCGRLAAEHADRHDVWRDCGSLAFGAQAYGSAEEFLSRAVALAPHHKDGWAWLYVTRLKLEKKQEKGTKTAQATLEEMLGRFASARLNVAQVLLWSEEADAAEVVLREGLDAAAPDVSILRALYYTLRRNGKDEEAGHLRDRWLDELDEEEAGQLLRWMNRIDARLERHRK
jgi:tetratricopeptide (TPR) repeat protein